MSALERLRATVARAILPRNMTSGDLARMIWNAQNGWESDGGESVTVTSAMQFADVHACVRVLSEDISALPLIVYERKERGKDRVANHWLFDLWQKPNLWQNGYQFRQLQQAHLELCGNFYAIKTIVGEEVRELLPISPDRMQVEQDKNTSKLRYKITWADGAPQELPADRVYHVRALSLDGITGLNPVAYYRQTITAGISQLKYGNKIFRNGSLIGGVLSAPKGFSQEAKKNLKESFDEKYSGVDNAGKTILLEDGVTFAATGIKAVDAEFMASQKLTRTRIAGLYRVPPHMIGDMEHAKFSNLEEQATNYATYGLLPRLRNIEAVVNTSLIPESLRRKYFVEHLVEGLLRAKSSERFAMYQSAVQTGWMNRNEVREKENMNPGPAELDEYLEPQFLTGSPKPSNDPTPDPTTDGDA